MTVRISLTDSDLELAQFVARRCTDMNMRRGDAPAYAMNAERMQDNYIANYASARCELATAKHTNRHWNASWWKPEDHHLYGDRADVGEDIEVKRIRDPHHNLLLKQKYAILNHILVLAFSNDNTPHNVDLIGWARGPQAWEDGTPPAWDQSGKLRLVRQDQLTAFAKKTS